MRLSLVLKVLFNFMLFLRKEGKRIEERNDETTTIFAEQTKMQSTFPLFFSFQYLLGKLTSSLYHSLPIFGLFFLRFLSISFLFASQGKLNLWVDRAEKCLLKFFFHPPFLLHASNFLPSDSISFLDSLHAALHPTELIVRSHSISSHGQNSKRGTTK